MRLDLVLTVATCAFLTGCVLAPPMCYETRSKTESNLEPEYPQTSKLQGEEGKTVLLVMVNAFGHPETIEVKTSSGFASLDRAAVDAVKTWCFDPATKDGRNVPATVLIPVVFQLPGPNPLLAAMEIKTTDDWVEAVRRKVRSYFTVPPDTPKNAETILLVSQTPDGHIDSARIRASSGFEPYDAYALKAIQKASPLPKFPNPEERPREFEIRMRAFEEPETTANGN